MNAKRLFVFMILAVSTAGLGIARAGDHPQAEHPKVEHPQAAQLKSAGDIVAVAAAADDFKTLVAAIKAAGLVETLQGKGPFTVFAPTDEAFAKLPEGALENLLKPENKKMLVDVLTYHVVPGKIMAADVKTSDVKTVNGQELAAKVSKDGVMVDQAKVIKTDIVASNGVIHVIDAVLLPSAPKSDPEADKPKDHPGH